MRFVSMSERTKVPQQLQPNLSRLLGMKLHSEQMCPARPPPKICPPYSQHATVAALSGARNECVKYTNGAGRHSAKQPRRAINFESVPAHVRRLHSCGRSAHIPRQHTQTTRFRRFLTALEHPLHAHADSEKRHSALDRLRNASSQPRSFHRLRSTQNGPHPEERSSRRLATCCGIGRDRALLPRESNAFLTETRFPAP